MRRRTLVIAVLLASVAALALGWYKRALFPKSLRYAIKHELVLLRLNLAAVGSGGRRSAEVWQGQPTIVAHAGGGGLGIAARNTKEALDDSYRRGLRWFELDFEQTADGDYVALHDWQGTMLASFGKAPRQMSSDEFLAAENVDGRQQLTLDTALRWFEQTQDAVLVTDCKTDSLGFLAELAERTSERVRIVPQVYSFEEFPQARKLGFESVLLTLYRSSYGDRAVRRFAEQWQPFAVVMPAVRARGELPQILSDAGVASFAHTINDPAVAVELVQNGINGVYSDTLIELPGLLGTSFPKR